MCRTKLLDPPMVAFTRSRFQTPPASGSSKRRSSFTISTIRRPACCANTCPNQSRVVAALCGSPYPAPDRSPSRRRTHRHAVPRRRHVRTLRPGRSRRSAFHRRYILAHLPHAGARTELLRHEVAIQHRTARDHDGRHSQLGAHQQRRIVLSHRIAARMPSIGLCEWILRRPCWPSAKQITRGANVGFTQRHHREFGEILRLVYAALHAATCRSALYGVSSEKCCRCR